jgi:hypothetical protein
MGSKFIERPLIDNRESGIARFLMGPKETPFKISRFERK